MSRNAFPRLEREYSEAQERLEASREERSRMSDVLKTIPGYVCIRIRDTDGGQEFYNPSPDVPSHLQTVWLLGIDRVCDVKVNDTGRMDYISGRSRAYWRFVKFVKSE